MPEQTTLQTDGQVIEPNEPQSLRESLEASFEEHSEPLDTRPRDEAGRFAPKTEQQQPVEQQPVVEQPEVPKLTTWKKEYLPLHEKLAQGLPLTPEEAKNLAKYNHQRETEYSTGVSVHRDRAQRLESVEKAIAPFMPELQKHNIPVERWIGELGAAHHQLVNGTPAQKLEMFQRLAKNYGIPLGAVQQAESGQLDPALMGVLEQVQQLQGRLQEVTSWRDTQEQSRVASAITAMATDTEKYPHFEDAKPLMAQLLESGLAVDLQTAYAKAIRMDDAIWAKEQERQSQANQSTTQARQAVAKAKAAAVSPRSATPSGTVGKTGPKDLRSVIESSYEEHMGGRV